MRLKLLCAAFCFGAIALASVASFAAEQQFADLGDLKLENGGVIKNCRMGYRTFGTLNRDRSNVVVYLMWAGGKTEQLHLEPGDGGKLIDTAKFYVVAIDPLSNGVSSSPSNSKEQPRMKFPQYSMRDLVNAEHQLLTQKLGITKAAAVTGVSMGGMQSFQWMVSYPDFAAKIMPIVGSPQLAPYDMLHWQTQIDAITHDIRWKDGDYSQMPAIEAEYEFGAILLTTPENFNAKMTREKVAEELKKAQSNTTFDANNKIRQDQAMMSIDVTERFGGSWESAAAAVRAKVFVIAARADHVVTPMPALNFARILKAQTLLLEGDCGHLAPSCESDKVNAAAATFLGDLAERF
jgi:homoserine O-acetyltransferase